jgi:hypothetical protein
MLSPPPRHSRARRATCAITLYLLALSLGGCYTPNPPKSTPRASAIIDGYRPIYTDSVASDSSADVILITTLFSVDAYETDTINETEYRWQFELFQVLSVVKGQWPYNSMSFICLDSHPQNTDYANARPWPYHSGVYMKFWLDTHTSPARIIGQQTLYLQNPG